MDEDQGLALEYDARSIPRTPDRTPIVEYALKRIACGTFEEVTDALERSIETYGFVVVGAHDVHVALEAKGFRIHPVRIYEIHKPEEERHSLGRVDLLPGRISVFMEGEDVAVAVIKPEIVTRMFPEAGLDSMAASLEKEIVAVVEGAVADRLRGSDR